MLSLEFGFGKSLSKKLAFVLAVLLLSGLPGNQTFQRLNDAN